MSEQGGTFMQMIGGVASEKCSSCQLVDLKMNEVWFGVHRLKSGVSQTKPPAGSDLPVRSWVKIPISPTACGLWWKVYFHPDLPGSHKNSPIFTTATPPRSHNQNLFCVGSDGYIRAQWIPLHSWRLRLWWLNTHQVAGDGKVCLKHPRRLCPLPGSCSCCAVLVIFCFPSLGNPSALKSLFSGNNAVSPGWFLNISSKLFHNFAWENLLFPKWMLFNSRTLALFAQDQS